jgi:hypothetical protein
MNEVNLIDYTHLTRIDIALENLETQYPFKINDSIKYTQHNIKLYKSDFCYKDKKETAGGGCSNVPITIISYN